MAREITLEELFEEVKEKEAPKKLNLIPLAITFFILLYNIKHLAYIKQIPNNLICYYTTF